MRTSMPMKPAARPRRLRVRRAARRGPKRRAFPVIGLRRKIAERMQEAKRHIPHFSYVEEVDVTELEALRAHLNAKWGAARGRLTPLPFIATAVIRALENFPQINARYDDEAAVVTRFGAVHLGVAAQTANGLIVPVVRHAESLDLWQIGAEIARLAAAARSGKAAREELSGSTITITSLGALGGIVTTPVINRPEVAIVGVNRIVERPMIRRGRGRGADDDEPVVVVRSSRRRRHGRRRVHPGRAGAARIPGDAVPGAGMKTSATQLLVIGGGPGGYVAAIRAAQLGIATTLSKAPIWAARA